MKLMSLNDARGFACNKDQHALPCTTPLVLSPKGKISFDAHGHLACTPQIYTVVLSAVPTYYLGSRLVRCRSVLTALLTALLFCSQRRRCQAQTMSQSGIYG